MSQFRVKGSALFRPLELIAAGQVAGTVEEARQVRGTVRGRYSTR